MIRSSDADRPAGRLPALSGVMPEFGSEAASSSPNSPLSPRNSRVGSYKGPSVA